MSGVSGDIMSHMTTEAKALELEVLRLAEALWGGSPGSAQAETVECRERDCIFRSDDLIHYVECTVSRSPKKIVDDSRKMTQFRESEAKKGSLVKLWIVTADPPGGDQVAVARRLGITILSIADFRNKLFNATAYLRCRARYRWGSATNPSDDTCDVSKVSYQQTSLHQLRAGTSTRMADLVERLLSRSIITVLGDYGMGKSMLIREAFGRLAALQQARGNCPVPIAINLRDHWGQTDPHEVLTRHAAKVGFEEKAQLVRAYNAGTIVLLIDGFDEIVSTPVASRRDLKKLRFDALTVVRRFVDDLRGRAGVLVAGRQNFFDTDRERTDSLGLRSTDDVYELAEFTSSEAEQLLEKFNIKRSIPAWLPRRPLFLAYLASHDLLADLQVDQEVTAAEAWHRLIDAICQREKRINEHLDAVTIRNILGNLADIASVVRR